MDEPLKIYNCLNLSKTHIEKTFRLLKKHFQFCKHKNYLQLEQNLMKKKKLSFGIKD